MQSTSVELHELFYFRFHNNNNLQSGNEKSSFIRLHQSFHGYSNEKSDYDFQT